MRRKDLRVVQHASLLITDLGTDLDRQLADEQRPAERLRMLRETTNRIVRAANDAVNAYARASRAVNAERARPHGNIAAADEMRILLDAARLDVLGVLEIASQRYPSLKESV